MTIHKNGLELDVGANFEVWRGDGVKIYPPSSCIANTMILVFDTSLGGNTVSIPFQDSSTDVVINWGGSGTIDNDNEYQFTYDATSVYEVHITGSIGWFSYGIGYHTGYSSLIEVKQMGTGWTNTSQAFEDCYNLVKVTIADCDDITTTDDGQHYDGQMFYQCSDLKYVIGDLNFGVNSYNRILDHTFYECTSLKYIGNIIAPKDDYPYYTFADCTSLICLKSIITASNHYSSNMFDNTPLLVAPNESEQEHIEDGANYTNPGACP